MTRLLMQREKGWFFPQCIRDAKSQGWLWYPYLQLNNRENASHNLVAENDFDAAHDMSPRPILAR